jgi:hypothetical protein
MNRKHVAPELFTMSTDVGFAWSAPQFNISQPPRECFTGELAPDTEYPNNFARSAKWS